MSFYGTNQNGGQPGSGQQQQIGRQPNNPGLQNVQQVLTPQLFNINVNPNQLHNFFNEHNNTQNPLQLNPAAGNQSILLQTQQPQSFPVNILNDQLGVGVGQLLTPGAVSQGQMQGLPISMPSALNFQQTIHQVHAQSAQNQQGQAQNQQSKQQRVFTGTVTKVHDNFGFIDEEVFFQMGVVKGPILPKEGDRVLVEADFNASMPFKWNATRVQIVNIGGGISSGLGNMSNQHSQQQHNMGFNTSMAMSKQSSAPPQQVHSSQANTSRPHGQPVSIVSNPHSVYSGGSNNPRGRATNVVGSGPPQPVTPLVPPLREPLKRPMPPMNLPTAPDPPSFINNPVAALISDRERDLDRSREAARGRSRERSRDRQRERERSRERVRARSRDRSRERARNNRSREREKITSRPRSRSRSRDRSARERSRDRGARDRSRDRGGGGGGSSGVGGPRDRSVDRPRLRSRSRSRDRDRAPRDRSVERRDRVKRDISPVEKSKDRSARGKDRDHGSNSKKSISPLGSRSSKEDSKKDKSRDKDKDKDKQGSNDKGKSGRDSDRTPSVSSTIQTVERSKRSRSRESVRTEKGTEIKSRSRSSSPRRKGLSSRPPPRYAVELPKFSLNLKDINAKEIHRRYPNLYVPSDFFLARSSWMDTFPLHDPFELGHTCPVHIMRRGVLKIEIPDVEGLSEKFRDIPDVLEPSDASFIFKAKVMVPSMNSLDVLYKKSCGIGEGNTDGTESPQHIDRLINFIVGMKTSKHEVMALGGPWSPSLDGSNPHSDPQTLVNTAIRCARALSGINLSRCKNWYRFMELYYKRTNCLETVVYFLPDVWSCLPDAQEWNKLKSLYKFAVRGEKVDLLENKEFKEGKNQLAADNLKSGPGTEEGLQKDGNVNGSSVKEKRNELSAPEKNGVGDCVPGSTPSTATVAASDSNSNTTQRPEDAMEVDGDDDDDDGLNSSGLLVIDEAASPSREDAFSSSNPSEQTPSETKSQEDIDDVGAGLGPETSQEKISSGTGTGTTRTEAGESMEDTSGSGSGKMVSTGGVIESTGTSTEEMLLDDNTSGIAGEIGVGENTAMIPSTNGDVKEKEKNETLSTPTTPKVNPKALNVVQLREQLNLRSLSTKGLKAQLISRLTEALEEENSEAQVETKDEVEKTAQTEKKPEPVPSDSATLKEEKVQAIKVEDQIEAEAVATKDEGSASIEVKAEKKETVAEEENCIRLVNMNTSLIFENQEEEEDDDDNASMEDGELKDDSLGQREKEFEQIFSKFPPNTFPIIKEGMKEEEVKMWERRYALPKNPRVLVYPSTNAKGGNFDCISMSLGLLRDYRIIDKKEDSFEVSLFSEFFHEMLQRDFAFRIYWEIVQEAAKPTVEEASTADKDKETEKDGSNTEPSTKRRKLSSASSVVTPATLVNKKASDPYLHLAFGFFDITRCGYITETDLEDLCCCIGIGLTRAQIRKTISKVVHKGNLYYKKLTEKGDKGKGKTADEIKLLSLGNMGHFPVFVLDTGGNAISGAISAGGSEGSIESESVIAVVDGKNIDVKKLLEQVEKYEKDLAVAESSLNVMKNSLSEAKSQVTDLKKTNESQKEELSKVKDTLKKSESSEKTLKENLEVFKRSTERYFDRVKDFIKLPSKEKENSLGKTKDKTKSTTQEGHGPTEGKESVNKTPEPSSQKSVDL